MGGLGNAVKDTVYATRTWNLQKSFVKCNVLVEMVQRQAGTALVAHADAETERIRTRTASH